MSIKIKCRINSMKIRDNKDNKSVGVTVCDELNFNNSVWTLGLNIDNNQPCSFKSKNSTIEKADDFFDFISAHSKETFVIAIEKKKETSSNNKTEPTIKLDDVVYKVVEIELIYG